VEIILTRGSSGAFSVLVGGLTESGLGGTGEGLLIRLTYRAAAEMVEEPFDTGRFTGKRLFSADEHSSIGFSGMAAPMQYSRCDSSETAVHV
jgi:hypothetical protein